MKEGNEGFKRFLPPTPFDWCQPNELGELPKRPQAFFDIRIENEELERIHFELASDIVPKTVDNFKKLCLGLGTKFGGYKGTKIFYTSKGVSMMGGDIVTETSSGTGNHSAGDSRYFNDENYIIPHTEKGLVRCVRILHPLNRHRSYLLLHCLFCSHHSTSTSTCSMASIGIHTNGSQFYIALAPMPQLNGRCVTFARIVKGMDSILAIEKVRTS